MPHIIDLTKKPNIKTVAGAREWFERHPPIEATVLHTHIRNPPTGVEITIAGDPQVQARLRCVPFGIYDPQKNFKNELRNRLKKAFRQQGIENFPIFGPKNQISVTATFNVVRMTKDIDNLLKLILDVLHGPLYENDADVTMVIAKKTHSADGDDGAYTELTVMKK